MKKLTSINNKERYTMKSTLKKLLPFAVVGVISGATTVGGLQYLITIPTTQINHILQNPLMFPLQG
jgi:hypothetical protein